MSDKHHAKRIRFAIQKVTIAKRLLKEATDELRRAIMESQAPTPNGGERKAA